MRTKGIWCPETEETKAAKILRPVKEFRGISGTLVPKRQRIYRLKYKWFKKHGGAARGLIGKMVTRAKGLETGNQDFGPVLES